MKYVWRLAFIAVILCPVAHAEVAMVKKTAQIRAFDNFDNKIAALENYTVQFVENGKKSTYAAKKSTPGRQQQKSAGEFNVELRSAKKKS